MPFRFRILARLAALALACAAATEARTLGPLLPESLIVDRIGTERGLPSQVVNTLRVDRAGLLWIGTREGLVRYDGYSARLFQYVADDPESLADNDVRAILEDREGRLWIGTTTGGLNLLDRATERFTQYRNDPDDPASLSNNAVFALEQDRGGNLWVGTHDGLNRLDPATGRIERFLHDPGRAGSLPGQWVMDLHEDREGRLWIASIGGGVARFDPATETFECYMADPDRPDAAANIAYALAEDASGSLWVGTATGIARLDHAARRLSAVAVKELAAVAAEPPIVTSLAFDASGVLWIATWTQGLVAFDPDSGESRGYRHDPVQPSGLGSNRVGVLRIHDNDVWLGTAGAGIHRFRADSGPFRNLVPPGKARGPERKEVRAVLEDRAGRIWVGTVVDGLFRHDRDGGWRQYLTMPGGSERLGTVLSLAEGPDGTIWIGTMDNLLRLGPSTDVLEVVVGWPDRPHGIMPDGVAALLFDRRERLWIGLTDGSLYRWSDGGRSFVRFGSRSPEDPSPGGANVSAIVEDTDGALWIGTRSGGLNRFDPETGAVKHFAAVPGDPRSLSHPHVSSLVRGRDGVLSVGTVGGGVDRLVSTESPGTFQHLGFAEGLVNPNVTAMLEDDDGSLWIATRNGLSRFDPASGRVRNYLRGDGARSVEFNQGAAARGRDALLFGTLDGVVSIRRGTPFVAVAPVPVRLVAIDVGGKPWRGAVPAWSADRIEVAYGVPLTLEVAVLDYRGRSRYRYRLGDDAQAWSDLGENRVLTLAGLAPDSYALEVQGRSSQGVWSDPPASLTVEVVPPFWMTGWFRGSIAALVIAAVALGVWRRTSVLERRNRELMALKDAREAALGEANRSREDLREAYERVRALARRMEEAKEEERAWIARELHDQMGQALSAAKLDLNALDRLPDGAQRSERLRDARALIDDMIRHVRSLSLDLRPPLLEELGLVMVLRGYAEGQSSRTGVAVEVEANDESPDLPPAIGIVAFRIVQEAVNNAMRHASAHRVTISVRHGEDHLAVTVRDDGRGFDVESTLARAGRGGHLGLLGMRERIETLGGTLQIQSEPGSGTEIRAVVPWSPRG